LYITPEILAKGEKVESVEVAETVAVVESVAVEVAAEPNEIVKPEEEKSGGVDDGPNLVVTVAFPLLIVTAVVGSIVAIVTVRKKKQ
jgi:hypothetical protein